MLAEPVDLADVAPTLLEWLEATPSSDERDGRSLLALTDSYRERPFERRPAVAELPATDGRRGARTARSADWRLVRFDDGEELLFDRLRDPDELRPVVLGSPRTEEALAELREALERATSSAPEPEGGP